jgi:hypothetical protein
MTSDVPIGSQSVRITLARHYGADDAHAGCAGDIRDHMMDLQIHLSECFLHMLDVGGCVVQQSLTLAQIGAQRSDSTLRPEAASQQAELVQTL